MEDSLSAHLYDRGTPAVSREEMPLPYRTQSRACDSLSKVCKLVSLASPAIKYPQNYITKFIMEGVNSTK